MSAQRVPWHGRANRRATQARQRPGIDRLARHRHIGGRAAMRDDVDEVHFARERMRQLEHVALEAAEALVREAAEGEDPDHGAFRRSRSSACRAGHGRGRRTGCTLVRQRIDKSRNRTTQR